MRDFGENPTASESPVFWRARLTVVVDDQGGLHVQASANDEYPRESDRDSTAKIDAPEGAS
jgi:hypothetical protein